jgi:hypothetical protein
MQTKEAFQPRKLDAQEFTPFVDHLIANARTWSPNEKRVEMGHVHAYPDISLDITNEDAVKIYSENIARLCMHPDFCRGLPAQETEKVEKKILALLDMTETARKTALKSALYRMMVCSVARDNNESQVEKILTDLKDTIAVIATLCEAGQRPGPLGDIAHLYYQKRYGLHAA